MKKVYLVLFVAVLLVACQAKASFKTISVEDFSELVKEDGVVILDVRSLDEYTESHITDAAFLDVTDSLFNEKALGQFNKNQKIAVYCRTGKRSKTASSKLLELGFKEIYDLDGGITEWKEAGYSVVE